MNIDDQKKEDTGKLCMEQSSNPEFEENTKERGTPEQAQSAFFWIWKTFKTIFSRPSFFFSCLKQSPQNLSYALLFAILIDWVIALGSTFTYWFGKSFLFLGTLLPFKYTAMVSLFGWETLWVQVGMLCLYPIWTVVTLYVFTSFMWVIFSLGYFFHWFEKKRTFSDFLEVHAYAHTAKVWLLIPLLGPVLSFVHSVILWWMGYKEKLAFYSSEWFFLGLSSFCVMAVVLGVVFLLILLLFLGGMLSLSMFLH